MKKYQIVVTEKCNQRCSYCYMNHNTKNLSLENFRKAYLQIEDDEFEIDLFGGEPLQNWDLCRDIIYVSEIDPRCKVVNMYTNGLLLDNIKARYLKMHNVKVHISFDGLWQDGSYIPYMEKLDTFRKVTDRFTTIVSPPNLKLVENLEFFNEIGFKCNMKLNEDNVWVEPYPEIFEKEFQKLCEYYEKNLVENEVNDMPQLVADHLKYMIKGIQDRYNRDNCGAGEETVCVGSDGEFYPCARFSTHGLKIEDSEKIRFESCDGCSLKYFCPKGCLWDNLCNDGPTNICKIYGIIFEEITNMYERLKDNRIWKNIILRVMSEDNPTW